MPLWNIDRLSFFHDSEINSSFPTRSAELVTAQSVREPPNYLEY